MTETQVTLLQIDNYGPWTVTPEPRPEPDLQALQAELYADLASLVGASDGYVFPVRFDNVVAVTNGIDRTAHARIQETIGNRYPVSVSMATGIDPSPAAALAAATDRLQRAGSAQADGRSEALCWGGEIEDAAEDDVRIAHFDVVDATDRLTDSVDAYDSFRQIQRAALALADAVRDRGGLAFFVGGDNVIAVVPDLERAAYEDAIDAVVDATGLECRVGVGTGRTPVAAGMDAKQALEGCRRRDRRIGGDVPATVGAREDGVEAGSGS